MEKKAFLITQQDIHAYVDGELSGERRRAVERFLAERDISLEQAATHLRQSLDLKAARDEIYKDKALKKTIDDLLASLRVSDDEPDA